MVNEKGFIPLVTLSPEWEQSFAESIVGQGDDRQLSMAPSKLNNSLQPSERSSSDMPCKGRPLSFWSVPVFGLLSGLLSNVFDPLLS